MILIEEVRGHLKDWRPPRWDKNQSFFSGKLKRLIIQSCNPKKIILVRCRRLFVKCHNSWNFLAARDLTERN